MGRLIDADAFKETLGTDTKIREMFCRIIDEQPTAYDVEKVVAELNTAESVKVFGSLNSGNRLIPVKDAIDIVRAGGVE